MSRNEPAPLKLRVGDMVEIRSEQEILATLDENGALDGLPFMPEMLAFCGQRLRVEKRADKTCDTITLTGLLRMCDTVHLERLRCSGTAHDGCQAYCSLFWKEAWLRRVQAEDAGRPASRTPAQETSLSPRLDLARLNQLTRRADPSNPSETLYRCQATDLLKASEPLLWWDFRQYLRDVLSGNAGVIDLVRATLFHIFTHTLRITAYRAQIWLYNKIQSYSGGSPYPFLWGKLDKTPRQRLDINPGELVRIKSYDEILTTLNRRNKNQGLSFDPEMVPYCGSVRRVIARVNHIIDDRSCKMIHIPSDCLLLEGTVCQARYSNKRLFCPRGAYAYWREIWLERVSDQGTKLDTSVPETAPTEEIPTHHQAWPAIGSDPGT